MNNTVRRYPRSLAEAFPADHANPIEGFKRPSTSTQVAAFLAVFVVFSIVWGLLV